MTTRIIPDIYTDYEDGHLGIVPASLANVEVKIGAAEDGQPLKVYTLSGSDAKKTAKTIFGGGPLLKAIEEAFDAGSTSIHAVRIGSASRASYVARDITGAETMRIKGGYGSAGNNHYINISHAFSHIYTGYAVVAAGTPNQVILYDEDFVQVRQINLAAEIATVVGVESEIFPYDPDGETGFRVAGYTSDSVPAAKVWRYTPAGVLDATQTLDLSSYLQEGESITGLGGNFDQINNVAVVTSSRLLFFRRHSGAWVSDGSWDVTSMGVVAPDFTSACRWVDIEALLRGDDPVERTLLLDCAAKCIYPVVIENDETTLGNPVDLATLVGDSTPEGIATDWETLDVLVSLRESTSLLRLSVDWDSESGPVATLVETITLPANVYGIGSHVRDFSGVTTVTIQDRNQSPVVSRDYTGAGNYLSVTAAVAAAINAGGIYAAEILADPALWLMPTIYGENPSNLEGYYTPMTGGADGGDLTNADYLAGLEATIGKTDVSWVHAVGAQTKALWTAVLTHCNEMVEQRQAERFAILETPQFSSDYDEGTSGYLTDLEDYVSAIVSLMATVGDRNAVVFAGGAQFTDSDGNSYVNSIAASCGGVMAGLEVQKSLINKPVSNIVSLVPAFSPGHIETLIQNRVNCVRLKPGRGFIIAHSLTAAAVGSDYSRVNDLRAVYYGAKAAREAGQPYVGEENDAAGEGLRRLESAMARPLEQMRDAGQIDDFELNAVSTENDRLLGDVYVSLGIQPRRAMEKIYTTVYLK